MKRKYALKPLIAGFIFAGLVGCSAKVVNEDTAGLEAEQTVIESEQETYVDPDPWERFNRSMYAFNSGLDKAILKPVAIGYKNVTPTPVQKGVSNFFSNLGEVGNIFNNLLQGKIDATASSSWRFIINSTAGWFGIFDVASEMGLKKQKEDFGETLGYWGISSGPYLVLPLFGPSTLRDSTDVPVGFYTPGAKAFFNLHWDEALAVSGLDLVETRASLLSLESLIIGDEYEFVRDVYLQNRQNAVYDGNPPVDDDAWGDDGWEDDDWGDEELDAEDDWVEDL
ncbi:MlaA family lipoprotein [Marinomonas sp. PE14-40]|uniref:MlaA family lipoprotein n=1 Tax=Marinomonas sp. PE14-40 TaxID=3060621 RepID=UPI003F67E7BA